MSRLNKYTQVLIKRKSTRYPKYWVILVNHFGWEFKTNFSENRIFKNSKA